MRLLVPGFSIGMPGRQLIRLADYYGLPLITLNSLITSSIREKTCLGKQARDCLEKGRLIPELLTLQLLEERLTEPGMCKDWVISGFPRNLTQAIALNSMLSDIGQPYDMAIYLDAKAPNGTHPSAKHDRPIISLPSNQPTKLNHSRPNSVKKTPLADFYIQHGLFFKVDNEMSFSRIVSASQSSSTALSEV